VPAVRQQGRIGSGRLGALGTQCPQLLAETLDRSGDDPRTCFDGLWDTLEEWVAADGFRGSFIANGAREP
jgi:hypothetical protein